MPNEVSARPSLWTKTIFGPLGASEDNTTNDFSTAAAAVVGVGVGFGQEDNLCYNIYVVCRNYRLWPLSLTKYVQLHELHERSKATSINEIYLTKQLYQLHKRNEDTEEPSFAIAPQGILGVLRGASANLKISINIL